MTQVTIHAAITGHVQHVWYRDFAQKHARELHITGWVKNMPNGNVEVRASGETEKIEVFKSYLWQGPILAKVKNIIFDELPWEEHKDFLIM